MPLAFLFDENQRGLLWRAALRHNRKSTDHLDIVRVGDPTDLPRGTRDPEILAWAENANRILVTFDKATMAAHLAAHLQTGRHSPGIFMLRRGCSLPQVVAHLVLAAYASEPWEWQDRIEYVPY